MADLPIGSDDGAQPVAVTDVVTTANILKIAANGAALTEKRSSTIATYSASIVGLAAAATPTDIFTVTGSATKTVKILKVIVSATATAETTVNLIFLKRSTANSAGTSSSPTRVSHDSSDAAATATVLAYTANPTLGTLVGNTHVYKVIAPSVAPGQPGNVILQEDFHRDGKPITLRGTSEVFAINLNSTTIAGNSFNISVIFSEE